MSPIDLCPCIHSLQFTERGNECLSYQCLCSSAFSSKFRGGRFCEEVERGDDDNVRRHLEVLAGEILDAGRDGPAQLLCLQAARRVATIEELFFVTKARNSFVVVIFCFFAYDTASLSCCRERLNMLETMARGFLSSTS